MKKEYAAIIRQAIKDTVPEDHIWKWTLKGNTLKWSYEPEFKIIISDVIDDEDGDYIKIKTTYQGETWSFVFVGEAFWCDYKSVEEALYNITAITIKSALRLF